MPASSVASFAPSAATARSSVAPSAARSVHSVRSVRSTASDQGLLPGKYRSFFAPEHHELVHEWYHVTASEAQRREFKRVVKAVLAFDAPEHKARLRAMQDVDAVGAHALVKINGALLADDAKEQAVQYLSFASPSERQAFRRTIGLIKPPPLTTTRTQARADFGPGTKFMNGERSHLDTAEKVRGRDLIRDHSAAVNAPCEVIAPCKTSTAMTYVWKTAPVQRAGIVQRAAEATFQGAPWGQYGDANTTQWVPQTQEDFTGTHYHGTDEALGLTLGGKAPPPTGGAQRERRFQNYNDNFTHAMNVRERERRHAKRELKKATRTLQGTSGSATGGDVSPAKGVTFAPDTTTRTSEGGPRHLHALTSREELGLTGSLGVAVDGTKLPALGVTATLGCTQNAHSTSYGGNVPANVPLRLLSPIFCR